MGQLLFGFGGADWTLLVLLFVLGAGYRPIDLPLFVATLLVATRLLRTAAGQRAFAFLLVAGLVGLAATALAGAVLPRFAHATLWLRATHQALSQYVTVLLAVWIGRHVALVPPPGASRTFGAVARLAWLALKVSVWSGAVVALLVILPGLIPVHVAALVVAVPLVIAHVVMAHRLAARPVCVEPSGGERPTLPTAPALLFGRPGVTRVAVAGACAGVVGTLVGGALAPPYPASNLSIGLDRLRVAEALELAPSPARSADGSGYHPAFLGQSATCGSSPCHPSLLADWATSRHRRAAGPAYRDAVVAVARADGPESVRLCAGCHDPIGLLGAVAGTGEAVTTPESRREGLSCLVCHALSARDADAANGAYVFRVPALFASMPFDPKSSISMLDEHRRELGGPGLATACVACHRFAYVGAGASEATDASVTERWMRGPHHAQRSMIDACRSGVARCVDCHMPRITRNDRPGQSLEPEHSFLPGALGRVPVEQGG